MQVDIMDKVPSADEVLHEVSRIKSIMTEAVEDGFKSAMKAINQSRDAAEDAIDDTRHAIKRHPQAMGIAFAAGMLLGGVALWAVTRRR
jgi:ElaB/YqjD/DUF883 family membrane-anchored ribosome-binding protein